MSMVGKAFHAPVCCIFHTYLQQYGLEVIFIFMLGGLCGLINCATICKLLFILWPMIKPCSIYKMLCRQTLHVIFSCYRLASS